MNHVLPLNDPDAEKLPALLQLKINLERLKPPVWRRILVPETITLDALHRVLQISFDWEDCHLHEFSFDNKRYGVPHPDYDLGNIHQEKDVQLKKALGRLTSFKYTYDFGDQWKHQIKVEKKLPGDPELSHRPTLLKAVNAAPPEDIGGPYGYGCILIALADPEHPDHEEFSEWYEGFDPEFVDVDKIRHIFLRFKI